MTVPLLVSLVGLTCCALTISVNFLTITKTKRTNFKNRPELVLIYIRSVIDLLIGIGVAFYLFIILVTSLDPSKVNMTTTYHIILSTPMIFLWPVRFTLSIATAAYRILVLAFPSLEHLLNLKILCFSVIAFSILTGISDLVFLLGLCPLNYAVNPGCSALGCMVSPCFVSYSVINRAVYFSLTLICTITHSFLICYCETKPSREKRIVRSDYWILLCMLIGTLFYCVPFGVSIFTKLEVQFHNLGPFVNAFNMFGTILEAIIVSKIFNTHQFF